MELGVVEPAVFSSAMDPIYVVEVESVWKEKISKVVGIPAYATEIVGAVVLETELESVPDTENLYASAAEVTILKKQALPLPIVPIEGVPTVRVVAPSIVVEQVDDAALFVPVTPVKKANKPIGLINGFSFFLQSLTKNRIKAITISFLIV